MSPLEPYQSDAFREMRKRVHSLSTPPTASPPRTHKQPSLPPSGTTSSVFVPHPAHIQSLKSPSPSPPLSEASPRSCPPSSSQTPLTQASDSSASSFDDIHMHQHRRSSRRATHKAHAWSGTHRRFDWLSQQLAQKTVFSEDDISSHRLAKRNRSQVSPVHSKRRLYAGRSTSASLPLTFPRPCLPLPHHGVELSNVNESATPTRRTLSARHAHPPEQRLRPPTPKSGICGS